MGALFAYILKSSACLLLFYLFYKLLLSRETFHRFNRLALLSLIAFSVCIPFIEITVAKATAIQYPLLGLEHQLLSARYTTETSAPSVGLYIILITYLLGVLIYAAHLFYSTCLLLYVVRKGEKIKLDHHITVVITDRKLIPFSWLNYIVITRTDWEENGREILLHERAHTRFRHSYDLIICELCTLLHWFNPAVWLLKQELQIIHEYEADTAVVNQGIDAKKYQLLLIRKAVGTQRFTSMANSFNHSKIKKRITMMSKRKSNAWARMKYVYVFPLAALAIAAFARPEISQELEKISNTKVSEFAPLKEHLAEKLQPIVVDTKKTVIDPVIYREDSIKWETVVDVGAVTKLSAEINTQVQEQIEKAMQEVNIQEQVDKAMQEINIQEQVEKALKEANIQEEIEKAMKDVNIQEQIDKAMEGINIQEQVEKALKEANIQEEIEKAMKDVEKVMKEKEMKEK